MLMGENTARLVREYRAAREAFGEFRTREGEGQSDWESRLNEARFEYALSVRLLEIDLGAHGEYHDGTHRYWLQGSMPPGHRLRVTPRVQMPAFGRSYAA